MATIAQIHARITNARKSRGPKTPAGKVASSRNAIKFGFLSRDPVIPGEDAAEWNKFRAGLVSLAPVGEAQEMLTERVADCAWRLRRFPAVEAAIFTTHFARRKSR